MFNPHSYQTILKMLSIFLNKVVLDFIKTKEQKKWHGDSY